MTLQEQTREPDDLREGQIDWDARNAIRNLVLVHGFEHAREMVAGYLNDNADRRPEWPRN